MLFKSRKGSISDCCWPWAGIFFLYFQAALLLVFVYKHGIHALTFACFSSFNFNFSIVTFMRPLVMMLEGMMPIKKSSATKFAVLVD